MTSVLIVDDAPLFQAGLGAALDQAGFTVAGQASDAEQALQLARSTQPDVVVLDVKMPGRSGVEILRELAGVAPNSQVVLLTSSESVEDMLTGIKAGARGFIVKDTPMATLVTALSDVAEGGAAVSPGMGGKLFDAVQQLLRTRDVVVARRPTLTGREIEILEHVASGETSRQIGERLFISENTVKNHVRNILDKLGLHSRSEAVVYAIREGLISVD